MLLFEYGGGQDYALASLLDSCAQKQRAQVLFNGSRADAEFGRYFFVAAALNQQLQDLLVTAGNFDLVQVQHCSASSFCWNADTSVEARLSPNFRRHLKRKL